MNHPVFRSDHQVVLNLWAELQTESAAFNKFQEDYLAETGRNLWTATSAMSEETVVGIEHLLDKEIPAGWGWRKSNERNGERMLTPIGSGKARKEADAWLRAHQPPRFRARMKELTGMPAYILGGGRMGIGVSAPAMQKIDGAIWVAWSEDTKVTWDGGNFFSLRPRSEYLALLEKMERLKEPNPAAERDGMCPDDGRCHHECMGGSCWRVTNAGPLSNLYPNDRWPEEILAGAEENPTLGSF